MIGDGGSSNGSGGQQIGGARCGLCGDRFQPDVRSGAVIICPACLAARSGGSAAEPPAQRIGAADRRGRAASVEPGGGAGLLAWFGGLVRQAAAEVESMDHPLKPFVQCDVCGSVLTDPYSQQQARCADCRGEGLPLMPVPVVSAWSALLATLGRLWLRLDAALIRAGVWRARQRCPICGSTEHRACSMYEMDREP